MGAAALLWVWLVLSFAAALATARWARRRWNERKQLAPGSKAIAAIVATSAMLGSLGTVLGLARALSALGETSEDPSLKARLLAKGISLAMNCTTVGLLLYVPSAIALLVLGKRRGTQSE